MRVGRQADEHTFTGIIRTLPAAKLAGWMWEAEESPNWPTHDDVRRAIAEIEQRTDRDSVPVRQALAQCQDYLEVHPR